MFNHFPFAIPFLFQSSGVLLLLRGGLSACLLLYLLVYKFAVRFVYMGTFNGSQSQLGSFYSRQRAELLFRKGGERFKVETEEGNGIDTMFFDRRK